MKASAARCDVAVSGIPLASPVSGGGAERFGGAHRGSGRDLRPGERWKGARGLGRKARRRGGKAKKRGLSRELRCRWLMAADRSADDGQRGAAPGRCGGARGCPHPVVAKDALLVSDRPTLRRRSPRTQPLDGGTFGAIACATGRRQPRLRRRASTRYLDNYLSWFHLVGLAPGANDRACLAAAR